MNVQVYFYNIIFFVLFLLQLGGTSTHSSVTGLPLISLAETYTCLLLHHRVQYRISKPGSAKEILCWNINATYKNFTRYQYALPYWWHSSEGKYGRLYKQAVARLHVPYRSMHLFELPPDASFIFGLMVPSAAQLSSFTFCRQIYR